MPVARVPAELNKHLTEKAEALFKLIEGEPDDVQHSLLTNLLLDMMISRNIPLSDFIEALQFGYNLKREHQEQQACAALSEIYKTKH